MRETSELEEIEYLGVMHTCRYMEIVK